MAQKSNTINNKVKNYVLQFGRLLEQEGIPVSKLVIFGSYAKNTASEDSDIDVCVVSSKFGKDTIDEMQFLFKQRRKIDSRIEPYPASITEFNTVQSPLMWEIRKFGLEISNLL